MTRENFYDVLIQILNLNIDFSIIFDHVEQPYRKEILDFVDYVRTKPSKEDIMKYNLSEKSKRIIIQYIDYILKKVKD